MTYYERQELILAEIDIQLEYQNGCTPEETLEAANKQALIELFRYVADRLEEVGFSYFDYPFQFPQEIALALLTHGPYSKFQVILRDLKSQQCTEQKNENLTS